MSKGFRLAYFVNLTLILAVLILPIVQMAIGRVSDHLGFVYFIEYMGLAITFCIPFAVLNVYATIKFQRHRILYAVLSTIMLAWVVSGTYNLVHFTPP
jgi:hypothetical protein